MRHLFDVISEDEQFLVINKPAGLVCHPTKGDIYSSLISRARIYLGTNEAPHLINRLDRETSGIVIMAKSSEASAELRKVWESRAVQKEYLAVVHGELRKAQVIHAPIGPDEGSIVTIKDCVRADGAACRTQVYPMRSFVRDGSLFSLVRVVLLTGRKHQIRIHMSHIDHPIVGDKLYGGDENLYLAFVKSELTEEQQWRLITENQCLHAALVSFELFGVTRTYSVEPENWFLRLANERPATRGPL